MIWWHASWLSSINNHRFANLPVGPVATGILLSQVCFAHKIGALGPSTGTYPAVLQHSKAEIVSTSVNHSINVDQSWSRHSENSLFRVTSLQNFVDVSPYYRSGAHVWSEATKHLLLTLLVDTITPNLVSLFRRSRAIRYSKDLYFCALFDLPLRA